MSDVHEMSNVHEMSDVHKMSHIHEMSDVHNMSDVHEMIHVYQMSDVHDISVRERGLLVILLNDGGKVIIECSTPDLMYCCDINMVVLINISVPWILNNCV